MTHLDGNSIPISGTETIVCQLSALLFPTFVVSQIDRFSSLLDSKLFILDGKPKADFSRMWQDIRVRHPSLKGGTMISFPVHVHVQNKEGIHRKTIFRGIPGPGAALVDFLDKSGIQAERGVEFQALVPWADPAEWTVGWNFAKETLKIVQLQS